MSEFKFRKGQLSRQIARRGLSQKEFAARAGVDEATILSADRGNRLMSRSWGRILIALADIPEPAVPAGMARRSA
jgi:transcriptional regulator with XRE-family HTH domain